MFGDNYLMDSSSERVAWEDKPVLKKHSTSILGMGKQLFTETNNLLAGISNDKPVPNRIHLTSMLGMGKQLYSEAKTNWNCSGFSKQCSVNDQISATQNFRHCAEASIFGGAFSLSYLVEISRKVDDSIIFA